MKEASINKQLSRVGSTEAGGPATSKQGDLQGLFASCQVSCLYRVIRCASKLLFNGTLLGNPSQSQCNQLHQGSNSPSQHLRTRPECCRDQNATGTHRSTTGTMPAHHPNSNGTPHRYTSRTPKGLMWSQLSHVGLVYPSHHGLVMHNRVEDDVLGQIAHQAVVCCSCLGQPLGSLSRPFDWCPAKASAS